VGVSRKLTNQYIFAPGFGRFIFEEEEIMSRRKECQHIFANGDSCGSPAKTGEEYCYYHLRYQHEDLAGEENYRLPILEDHNSVQLFLADVMRGLLRKKLTVREANALFYGAQVAMSNLARWEKAKELADEADAENTQQAQEPIMLKLLREGLAGATVAAGPHAGRPAGEVLAEKIAQGSLPSKGDFTSRGYR